MLTPYLLRSIRGSVVRWRFLVGRRYVMDIDLMSAVDDAGLPSSSVLMNPLKEPKPRAGLQGTEAFDFWFLIREIVLFDCTSRYRNERKDTMDGAQSLVRIRFVTRP